MHSEDTALRGARLEGWGGPTDLGSTRDRQFMCASRASPTCVFETPRTRQQNLGRSQYAAPHHEAGRDCGGHFNLKSWPNLLQMV